MQSVQGFCTIKLVDMHCFLLVKLYLREADNQADTTKHLTLLGASFSKYLVHPSFQAFFFLSSETISAAVKKNVTFLYKANYAKLRSPEVGC